MIHRFIRNTRKRTGVPLLLACWLLCLPLVVSPAYCKAIQEYHIKAVFLYNLIHFVEWPISPAASDTTFIISILGEDPFGDILADTIKDEEKNHQKIIIKHFYSLESLIKNPGNLLYISPSHIQLWPQLKEKIKNAPVLTVADSENFASEGGMINLLKAANRVEVEVNRTAIEEVGLTISSKLLRLARIID